MKPKGGDTPRPYLPNMVRLSGHSRNSVDLQMFCRSISPARYSDARIDSDKIVIVGFCHPALVNCAPSTTNRFLWSCDWLNLFSTLFFGSFPILQVPTS